MSQNTKNDTQAKDNEIKEQLEVLSYKMNSMTELSKFSDAINQNSNEIVVERSRVDTIEVKIGYIEKTIEKLEENDMKILHKMEILDTSVKAIIPKVKEKMLEVKDDMLDFQVKTNSKIIMYVQLALGFSALLAGSIGFMYRLYFTDMKQDAIREKAASDKLIEVLKIEIKNMSVKDTTGKR